MSENIIKTIEKEEIARLTKNKNIPYFVPGDTVNVSIAFSDGAASGSIRYQNYEGLVIAKKNRGLMSSFTLRRVIGRSATERVFPLYSPSIASISVVKCGKVRRAKLYYMRDMFGKAVRIKEDINRNTKRIKQQQLLKKEKHASNKIEVKKS